MAGALRMMEYRKEIDIREDGRCMNIDFLDVFQPHILNISKGNDNWKVRNYMISRDQTFAHSLALVYEGEGSLELNGIRYELRRGALFYVPIKSSMRIRTQEENSLKYHSIIFHYGTLRWEGEQGIWSNANQLPLPLPDIVFFEEEPVFLDSFRTLEELWMQKLGGNQWDCKKEFKHLLELMIRKKFESSSTMPGNWTLIEQAITYIREHLDEPIDRNALARSLSISPAYFTALFKQYTGYTPVQFLLRLRVDRAKQLLKDTGLSINRIAKEVGYDDSLYFSRMFVKHTGISPRNFRNS
ncbi:AraC family transcriptional regulator [Paenibacillus hemerocallicola]|nr:helix-turn-helix domain-containing protein [Paenibacillus hemerocallicola]